MIGEYLLRAKGKGRFEVHSAGAKPTGRVNPLALWVLKERFNIDARDARSLGSGVNVTARSRNAAAAAMPPRR